MLWAPSWALPSCCARAGEGSNRRKEMQGWNRAGVEVKVALAPLPRPPWQPGRGQAEWSSSVQIRRLRLRRQIQGLRLPCLSASLSFQPKLAGPSPKSCFLHPLHRACRQPPEPLQGLSPFLVPTLSAAGPGSSALETRSLPSTCRQVPGPGHRPHSLAPSCWSCPSSLFTGLPRKHRQMGLSPASISCPYLPLVFRLEGLTLCTSLGSKPGQLGMTGVSPLLISWGLCETRTS